jgi:hypothetical protein
LQCPGDSERPPSRFISGSGPVMLRLPPAILKLKDRILELYIKGWLSGEPLIFQAVVASALIGRSGFLPSEPNTNTCGGSAACQLCAGCFTVSLA